MKTDKSRSETDFGRPGSLRGSVGISKTARKVGLLWPRRAHLIVSQRDVGGARSPRRAGLRFDRLCLNPWHCPPIMDPLSAREIALAA